jgi:queuosine biosynthesis protein QueC
VREAIVRAFPQWAQRLGEDHMIDLSVLGAISDTAMTREIEIESEANGLPNTFVPGRNLMFMTIAAAIAYRRGLSVLVGGMCETDFSGYPDCRDDTMKALQVALNLGMDSRFVVETPRRTSGAMPSWSSCAWRRIRVTWASEPSCINGASAAASVRPAACASGAMKRFSRARRSRSRLKAKRRRREAGPPRLRAAHIEMMKEAA